MILLGLGLYFQTYGDGASASTSASVFFHEGNVLMYNGYAILI